MFFHYTQPFSLDYLSKVGGFFLSARCHVYPSIVGHQRLLLAMIGFTVAVGCRLVFYFLHYLACFFFQALRFPSPFSGFLSAVGPVKPLTCRSEKGVTQSKHRPASTLSINVGPFKSAWRRVEANADEREKWRRRRWRWRRRLAKVERLTLRPFFLRTDGASPQKGQC